MPTLQNTMRRVFVARFKREPGSKGRGSVTIPGGSFVDVADEELTFLSENQVVKALLADGSLVCGDGGDSGEEPTLEEVAGSYAERLDAAGITSVEMLALSSAEALTGIQGIGDARATQLIEAAQAALGLED